ncbi:hypothetical protein F4802DRAFT_595255 [Xylaria palmicola]|nr:hypothetical protein F4802DRAFT_595255 [Xylaria palmicola]
MENLGRGVVATRSSESEVFISWRLLGLDPDSIKFNLYRAAGHSDPELITKNALTAGTNFVDKTANLSVDNTYTVVPVLNNKERDASKGYTLVADSAQEPVIRFPIRDTGEIKWVWVGDLDGDGEYDYILDRQTSPQRVEAYLSNGTFLWDLKLGPGSENQNNISPGPATINVGHWDGLTVYDFDSDGKAEVAVRIADGVTFGDGKKFSASSDTEQYIAILDGMTGALRAKAKVPQDYVEAGPLPARFGVGYLDGVTPHLVTYMKNRNTDKSFNLVYAAWTFDGKNIKMKWKWLRGENAPDAEDGHNTLIVDVNGDGKDELGEIGFLLNGDGTLRYNLKKQGIVHGDRWYITKMDPTRANLQGYGIQQNNELLIEEYYYDASTGEILWMHNGTEVRDIGRGMVADIDPDHPGMEIWTFKGLYNAPSNKLTQESEDLTPYPQTGVYWDGDELRELYNSGVVQKWDPKNPTDTKSVPRIMKIQTYGGVNSNRRDAAFVADILGDWREEMIAPNADYTELLIFTTNIPSDIRLYTLPHNPAYRNGMTLKGYVQAINPDYFIGYGMKAPPKPNIKYVGA